MKKVDNNKYKAEDFLVDENFRNFFRDGVNSPESLDKFLEKNHDETQDIKLAVKIIEVLDSDRYTNQGNSKLTIWRYDLLKQKRRIVYRYLRYAAVFLLFIGIGSLVLYFLNRQPVIEKYAFLKETSNTDAILILADGKQIGIQNQQSKIHYTPDGTGIIINETSEIEQTVPSEGINQIIVPYGRRSKIILSDGSVVWLNSGSKMNYTPVFNGKNREVLLEGEAYFDVAKNPEKPFIVHTSNFDIQVHGTRFDVNVYNDDNENNTVVIEGKVSLSTKGQSNHCKVFLESHQKASISKKQNDFNITNVVNSDRYADWINGYYSFANESLTDVMKKISRYYNINIELKLRIDVAKINGKLDLNKDLEKVLNGIAIISNTKFSKEDDKYIFRSE